MRVAVNYDSLLMFETTQSQPLNSLFATVIQLLHRKYSTEEWVVVVEQQQQTLPYK
jgi:hypothetical protein